MGTVPIPWPSGRGSVRLLVMTRMLLYLEAPKVMTVAQVSELLQIHPFQVHRYMDQFIRLGIAEKGRRITRPENPFRGPWLNTYNRRARIVWEDEGRSK